MKRVLIFSLAYYPFVGGAEVAIKEITDRIDRNDIAFDLLCAQYDAALPREEQIGNVHVYRVGWGKRGIRPDELMRFPWYIVTKVFYPMCALAKAIQLDRRNAYDACWAMMAYMGFPILFFRLLYRKVPYLLSLQEGDTLAHITNRLRVLPLYFLLRRVFRDASVVQAISTYLANWAKEMGFTGSLEVIPNGVDTERFAQRLSHEKRYEILQRLNKKEGDVFLITTSRLVHKNAVDDVIKALALLPAHVQFLVLGTGPDEAVLRALASREGVLRRVQFLGHIHHAELPGYLQASDIFIRPSRSEGMGNSFIEAMALGLPVIATQEGGIADFLFDPKRNPAQAPTGRAVHVDSPAAIAQAVELYLHDPETTERIIGNAKALAHKKYDWNLIARHMREKVFAKLIP